MPENPAVQRRLARIERPDLVEAAATVAGFAFTRPEFGTAANVSGIRSRTRTFSRRTDSRTLFATDARYGAGRRLGAWTGSDRTAAAACRRVLRAAKVPSSEVAGVEVLSEYGQVAERASEEELRVHEPHVLRKVARARRAVDGIPVWSSYATVGLTAERDPGWIEVHWPELPSVVIREAGLLHALIGRGYHAPELPDARPESVDVGVIHSPAVGFFLDISAVVRIVYAGADPQIGRKATLYLDRHGDAVARPRDIELAEPEPLDRPKPGKVRQSPQG